VQPLKENKFVIPKSRYAPVSMYIAQDARFRPEYNDVEILQDQKLKQMMLDGGKKRSKLGKKTTLKVLTV